MLTGGTAKDIIIAANVSESAIEHNLLQHLHPDFYLTDEERQVNLEAEQELTKQSILYVKEHPVETVEHVIDAGTLVVNPVAGLSRLSLKKTGTKLTKEVIKKGNAFTKQGLQYASKAKKKVVENNKVKLPKKSVKRETTKTTAEKVVKGGVRKSEQSSGKSSVKVVKEEKKLRGTRNPIVESKRKLGVDQHNKLNKKINAKRSIGWKKGYRMVDPKTGKIVIPDGLTPSGRPIELKPFTSSGIKKGRSQLPQYERATGKKGRVIYYDPKNSFQ